ncbi:uncharacterized protein PV06_11581 [Exophiala oligosperma]|uniref:Uncharacterized protein n=1 Tax=Exophiala oligosperma TaxID=215243 RepID=A0A0D2A709_9EURO|nr:uncharacterized protein PV06_11581 [Exophiala oligosperma]KIW36106.1 hypothetical protein PV06_11581 [Exophiala oligosperma]
MDAGACQPPYVKQEPSNVSQRLSLRHEQPPGHQPSNIIRRSTWLSAVKARLLNKKHHPAVNSAREHEFGNGVDVESLHPMGCAQDGPFVEYPKMFLQPRPGQSRKRLVNEVKGIYAGLVMVEKKCVEICQQQSQTTTELSNEQWQALIALHRTLLHEHHDFFLASQYPTASPVLRRLHSGQITKFDTCTFVTDPKVQNLCDRNSPMASAPIL